jgi:hypothetical protein
MSNLASIIETISEHPMFTSLSDKRKNLITQALEEADRPLRLTELSVIIGLSKKVLSKYINKFLDVFEIIDLHFGRHTKHGYTSYEVFGDLGSHKGYFIALRNNRNILSFLAENIPFELQDNRRRVVVLTHRLSPCIGLERTRKVISLMGYKYKRKFQ